MIPSQKALIPLQTAWTGAIAFFVMTVLFAGTLLTASLFTATAAEAQAFGRVKIVVLDPEGNPVEGAVVQAVSEELGNFDKSGETNKKGQWVLSVVDATKIYQISVKAEGYPEYLLEIKPRIRDTITEEVRLESAAPPPSTEGVLTPAQQAFNAGVEASQADDVATSKAKFQEALALDKSLHLAHLALAGIYYDEKNFETALAEIEALLEADPRNARGLRILYEVHSALGNKNEAKAALRLLSEIDSSGDAAAALYNEGVAAYRVGDNEVAKQSFLQALEVQPDLYPAIKALAQINFKDGDFATAAQRVEKLLEVEPENETYLRMRWEAYRMLGDEEKEKEAFLALADKDPKVMIKDIMEEGAKLFEGGDTAAAQERFEQVLLIDPDHPRAHYRMGLILVSSDPEAAKGHFTKFLELAPETDPERGTAQEMLSYLQ